MFKFVARTHSELIARHALGLGLGCERDPIHTGAFNIECSCEDDKEAFDSLLQEQGFGLNVLTWKVKGLSADTASTSVPEDAQWQRISGGGQNYVYLIRPREAEDHKIYGVKELP